MKELVKLELRIEVACLNLLFWNMKTIFEFLKEDWMYSDVLCCLLCFSFYFLFWIMS